ncbi:hypothetical protein [Malacoplasma penetrans]|uniref:hypothetical protein n=1 Tax=Malacoplasma penetrans TaxID=28227 RepID=UPI0013E99153|nr:hypothetical protein [Malacoplasma penetrans]
MIKKLKNKKLNKFPVLKETFSNRQESIVWENNTNRSLQQWDETKESQKEKEMKNNLEIELRKREEQVKIEKQKVFLSEIKKESLKEEESFSKRAEIDEKIRNKKRKEIKKRDIEYRNRNYG